MKRIGIISRKASGRYALRFVLWMQVLITMISALAPQGLPTSSARGSAFNPATPMVAIKSREVLPVATLAPSIPPSDDPPIFLTFAHHCALISASAWPVVVTSLYKGVILRPIYEPWLGKRGPPKPII